MHFVRAVDAFHQTVMPKSSINCDVLRICKVFERNSIKLNCLDTKSLESLDLNLFLIHFRVHGVLKIKISTINVEEIDA